MQLNIAPSSSGRPLCVALVSKTLDMTYLVPALQELHPGVDCRLGADLGNLDDVDVAICWFPPAGVLAKMPNLKLIHSLGAGVDHIYADPELPKDVPVCRISEPGMTGGMNAYVCWAVINQHRFFPDYVASSATGVWKKNTIIPPAEHRVGIAGMGKLGQAAARALLAIGYPISGWSRNAKEDLPAGVTSYHGPDGLAPFLAELDTLICLLPLTEETKGFLGAKTFSQMKKGSHLINVGRGGHVVEDELLQALESGQLSFATLDTTLVEPLPAGHPFWSHSKLLVTPHIATRTPASSIARETLENYARLQAGEPLHARAHADKGY